MVWVDIVFSFGSDGELLSLLNERAPRRPTSRERYAFRSRAVAMCSSLSCFAVTGVGFGCEILAFLRLREGDEGGAIEATLGCYGMVTDVG